MNKLLAPFLLFLVACASTARASIRFAWDASTSPEVTQYVVYSSANGSAFTPIATVPAAELTAKVDLPEGRYTVHVRASTGLAESDPSNEITVEISDPTPPPPPPPTPAGDPKPILSAPLTAFDPASGTYSVTFTWTVTDPSVTSYLLQLTGPMPSTPDTRPSTLYFNPRAATTLTLGKIVPGDYRIVVMSSSPAGKVKSDTQFLSLAAPAKPATPGNFRSP